MKLKMLHVLAAAALLVLVAVPLQAAEGDRTVDVETTGEGANVIEATNDAMRNAVEEGAGMEIQSFSQVKDFQLVRDEILTRSNGYCTNVKVLSKNEDEDGTWTVKIKTTVKVGKFTTDWKEIQLIIHMKGHPKMLVMIVDKIDGNSSDSEITNSVVVQHYLKKGFTLIDKDQIKAVHSKELRAASLKNDVSKLIALAKTYKAQVVITGVASASFARTTTLYGRSTYFYSADCTLKVVRTDDAKLIYQSNYGLGVRKQVADTAKEQAAKKALKSVANTLATESVAAITKAWIHELFTANDITVSISNCKYKLRRKIKKEIKKLKKIKSVFEQSYAEKVLELTVTTTLSATQLLDKLVDEGVISEDADMDVTANKIAITLEQEE